MRAFRVAYDGRPFHGFQRQPSVPTVEDALLDALNDLGVLPAGADVPPGYAAAGRTDAGVSAAAQTVAFEAPAWCSPAALNAELPGSVRAWAAADVPEGFHATHDADRREYVYQLHAPADAVDDARVAAAARALSGEHDLRNLTSASGDTVRDLQVSADRDGEFVVLTLVAGGFLRHLARRVASLVRAVGTGDSGLDRVERLLGPEPVDGPDGVPPAPPGPLVLTDVRYPAVEFRFDSDAVGSAREVFAARRRDRLAGARAAGSVLSRLG